MSTSIGVAPGNRETEEFIRKLLLVVLFLAAFGFGYGQDKTLPVIFDTDMGPIMTMWAPYLF